MDCDGVVKGDMIATVSWWLLDVVTSAMVLVVVVVVIAGTTSGGGWLGMKRATTITTTPGRNGDGQWRIASLPHSWTASEAAAAATINAAIAEAATQHPRV